MRKEKEESIREILRKYRRELDERIGLDREIFPNERFSREYNIFRKEALSRSLTMYEKLCNFSEKLIKVRASERERDKIREAIELCHLNISVDSTMSFAVLSGLFVIFLGVLIFIGSFLLGNLVLFLPLVLVIAGFLLIRFLSKYPLKLADKWRLEASSQMVLCILYVVIYMRHTSNLEHAIKFAGEHIGAPLNLDLRKVLWDVETGKFVSIKESLDSYLEKWKDHNLEFVEAFHLIESSLYEGYEPRRLKLLEKALEVMLQGTYENMLHYAHDLRTPITMLHMLGIVLPILGLVIFPLLGSFMGGLVRWWHLLILYNFLLPIVVYYFGVNLLSKRPTGYGESDILKVHPEFKKKVNKFAALSLSVLIILIFMILGFVPIFAKFFNLNLDFWGYNCEFGKCTGPYGLPSLLFSLLIPFGIALGLSIYFRLISKDLIKIKRNTNKLEKEFSSGLFQLGNRVGEGIPVEIAFGRVANSMVGTPTGNFFRIVSTNIRKLGMSVKDAIFDVRRGAILYYPSSLIESSMKVLVQAAKKSPQIVAKSMLTISDYVNRIHQIDERLKDLLADIISSMKSQIRFLAPMISGIVVAVGSMIVTIINKLSEQFAALKLQGMETGGVGGISGLMSLINIKDVIPSFQLQVIIGVYLIEVVFILTILGVGIEKGVDKITEKYELGNNLLMSVGLYSVIALIGILVFNVLASGISAVAGTGLS